jgi:hypothetical protein
MNLRGGTSCWCVMLILIVVLVPMPAVWAVEEIFFDTSYVPTVLITGSNRGIGFEFTRQYRSMVTPVFFD